MLPDEVRTDRGPARHRRALLLDGLLATAVFAYNLPVQGLTGAPGDDVVALLVPVGLCAPWLVRRRHPVAALAVMLAAATVQVVVGLGPLVADVMLPLGVLAVARRHTWRISVPALVLVVAWVLAGFAPRLEELMLTVGDVGSFTVLAVAAWLAGTLGRTRAAYVASLREQLAQAEREQAARERMATAAERTRIARELHDIVSHHLSAIGLLSDGAASTVADDPDRAAAAMRTVRDTTRTAMAEMRSMLSVLRDDSPREDAPTPGVADLPALAERAGQADVPVHLRIDGDAGSLAPGASLAVYRIVQEALTNVRRHAGPDVRTVAVTVAIDDREVRVRVDDDGRGPGVSSAPGSGHGLVGMRERAAALRGTLETGPGDAGGFSVLATLPRSEDA